MTNAKQERIDLMRSILVSATIISRGKPLHSRREFYQSLRSLHPDVPLRLLVETTRHLGRFYKKKESK